MVNQILHEINSKRVLKLKTIKTENKNVLYYTIRDIRLHDNWAVIHSQNLSYFNNSNMYIAFSVLNNFLDASIRQYSFLKEGLLDLNNECEKFNISFNLLYGHPKITLKDFIKKYKIGYLVIEQFPLKIFKDMIEDFKLLNVNIHQVDAHNIIPVWITSDKSEYNARTIRIKINKLKNEFLTEYPKIKKFKSVIKTQNNDFDKFLSYVEMNKEVPQIINKDEFIGGQKNGMIKLNNFLKRINDYDKRNNANKNYSSRLSFWLHFGMISSQRCVIEANKLNTNSSILTFIEEIFVRKELADNFCYYNNNYKNLNSSYKWAIETLNKHEIDRRVNIFSLKELELCQTNDRLWNACQNYIINYGYLNGYLRMYWAKKILEWSNNAQEAINKTIILNDRYFIDGRDPNGYVGILWSIAGLHDRAFKERLVYGKIRYMSINGIKKFTNIEEFIKLYSKV